MRLPKYSFGLGDRFAREGVFQLEAILRAAQSGVTVAPVWNKSHREHKIIGTQPADVRAEADAATRARGYKDAYFVDADHIRIDSVDAFLAPCDYFTLDVADFIGTEAPAEDCRRLVRRCEPLIGELSVPGLDEPLVVERATIETAAAKYLLAVQEAGRLYRHIRDQKSQNGFVTEISLDETDSPQTPVELLLILAAIAEEDIPADTIAPRFPGRFNKGVDYVGDMARFAREFEQDLAVVAFAVREFGLPEGLKLSVHSGSDKFSIYQPMRRAMRKFDAGLHLKTAGTTWLEELIGLAEAGGDGLALAKEIYRNARGRFEELCAPYATVIDIDTEALPSPERVDCMSGPEYAATLRHDQKDPAYNPHFRQLLHVGFKVAAEMGERFFDVLRHHSDVVGRDVTENVYERHLRPLFLDE
ncbi:MAG: tagaturonate epimerase family protein [Thermoguttaceae bacterium]